MASLLTLLGSKGIHKAILSNGTVYHLPLFKTATFEPYDKFINRYNLISENQINLDDSVLRKNHNQVRLNKYNFLTWNCEDYVQYVAGIKQYDFIKITFFIILILIIKKCC